MLNVCSQIDGRQMTQTTFSQNNVKVSVSDNTVRINSTSSLQVSFSSTNKLTISASNKVADVVCGACGTIRPTKIQDLTEGLQASLGGQRTAVTSLNIGQWTAHDFPQW